MTCDPFPGRCRRCGIGLMTEVDLCGRGTECRTPAEALRDTVAAFCSTMYRCALRLGLIR